MAQLKSIRLLGSVLNKVPLERRKLRKFSWLPDVFRLEGSIIFRILGPVLTVTLFAVAVASASEVYGYQLNLSNSVLPLLSVVVGLILVFRNGTSYDRYYEGRRDFAVLVSTVRNLSRLIWVQVTVNNVRDPQKQKEGSSSGGGGGGFSSLLSGVSKSQSPRLVAAAGPNEQTSAAATKLTTDKIRAIKLLLSFVYAVMHHLRGEPGTDYEDFEGVLPDGFKYNATDLGVDKNSLLNRYATWSAIDRGRLGHHSKSSKKKAAAAAVAEAHGSRHPSFVGKDGPHAHRGGDIAPNESSPLIGNDHTTVMFNPHSTPASLPLPLIIGHELARLLYKFKRKGYVDPLGPAGFSAMNVLIATMVDQFTALERVATTPIPISYGIHLKQCVTVYLFSLPFTLINDMHWKMVPLVTVVAFTLMGIEGIADEIEMPFGKTTADLPLERYCAALRSEVEYIIERLPEGPEEDLDPFEE